MSIYFFKEVNNMKQVQRGFTLIELVMVIVILGVLAAVAIPKFVDLKADAQQAAVDGVAGALASASAINYASNRVTPARGVTIGVACSNLSALLQGGLPSGVANTGTLVAGAGTCTVASLATPAISRTFTATGD
jgi:MSHA pilin protein MshA